MSELDIADVAKRFGRMSEPELMAVAQHYDDLVASAQELLRAEFSRRSLEPPLVDDAGIYVLETQTLVTIRRFRDLPEAFIARSVLQNAGIPCFLQDENTVRNDWLWSNLLGGARLQVPAENEAEALEILSQPIPPSIAVPGEQDFEQPACPVCHSLNVSPNDRGRKLAVAATVAMGFAFPLILGLPALAFQRSLYTPNLWLCADCSAMWQDDGGQTQMPAE